MFYLNKAINNKGTKLLVQGTKDFNRKEHAQRYFFRQKREVRWTTTIRQKIESQVRFFPDLRKPVFLLQIIRNPINAINKGEDRFLQNPYLKLFYSLRTMEQIFVVGETGGVNHTQNLFWFEMNDTRYTADRNFNLFIQINLSTHVSLVEDLCSIVNQRWSKNILQAAKSYLRCKDGRICHPIRYQPLCFRRVTARR